MKKIVNGIEVDLTPEEIEEYNLRQQQWEESKPQRLIEEFTEVLGTFINETAKQKSYSSAVSCASYVNSTNPQWTAEARTFIQWRDIALAYAYDYFNQAQSGEIPNPNINDFIAGVPAISWP